MALTSYQHPRIAGNSLGPRAGIGPRLRLRATRPPHPRLADAVQEWCCGHSPPPGTPHRWRKPVSTGLRTRCPHCGDHAAAAYWQEGYAQPVVVCSSCAPTGQPVYSSSGSQLIADVRKLLEALNGTQYYTMRALRAYSHRNFRTQPQECRQPHRGAQDGPVEDHAHRWTLWGRYSMRRIIETHLRQFQIRKVRRIYDADGHVVHANITVVMRADQLPPTTWLTTHCQDDEISDILYPDPKLALFRLDHDVGIPVVPLGPWFRGLVEFTKSVMNSSADFWDETRYKKAHPRLFQNGIDAGDGWFGPRTRLGVPKWVLPRAPTPAERTAWTAMLQSRRPVEVLPPLVAKVSKDLGITVDAARVMVAYAERRARDRESEWSRRRMGKPLPAPSVFEPW